MSEQAHGPEDAAWVDEIAGRFEAAWRSVHMLSYGCWGATVVHSIGIGSDARSAVWGVMVVAACIGAVGGAWVQRTASVSTR